MTVSEPQAGARLYVTEIWCPPADSGVHALDLAHARAGTAPRTRTGGRYDHA